MELKYRELFNGSLNRSIFITEIANPYDYIQDHNKQHFLSTCLYTENQMKEVKQTGNNDNITKIVTNKLWFDFDIEFKPIIAKQNTITLIEKFISIGIDPKDIIIFYDGNLNLGLEISLTEEITPIDVKSIAFELASDLPTFRTHVYNAHQNRQMLTTKHKMTGLYTIPISYDQLKSLEVDQIIELSKEYPKLNKEQFRWNSVKLPGSLRKLVQIKKSMFT